MTPGRLSGEVVYLYAFDVANEIRLGRAAELLSAKPVPFAVRSERTAPRSQPIARPLEVEPATPATGLGGRPIRPLVRVYEVGVVSVSVRVALEADGLAELMPFHHPALDDGRPLDALARGLCEEVCRRLDGCLVKPGPVSDPEAYTAFCLTDLGGEPDTNRWLADRQREAAGLLADTDPTRLSDAQVAEVLRLRRSFENADLVVIDWDAALVVDLTGYPEDVLLVLELANLQLEEFRWIDRTLDGYMDRAYDELGRPRWPLGTGSGAALRTLRRLRIDLAKLADEATHVTKFIGDWHLARVHLMARERFHLDQWRASVEDRLGQLDRLYTVAHNELHERRMLWLEVVIVALFVIDVLALFLWKT
jgi:hypothetical protein